MRLLPALIFGLVQAASAGQAGALECHRYADQVQRTFWQHADAGESYSLVYGRLKDFRLLTRDKDQWGSTSVWRATLIGFAPSQTAFDIPFNSDLYLDESLSVTLGSGTEMTPARIEKWLGSEPRLIYLMHDGSGYRLRPDLCDENIDDDPASVPQALDCVNGRDCPRPRD